MFGGALARVLAGEPDVEVVGTGGTVAEGLALLTATRPHVVVLDVHLPDGDGIDALPALHDASPDTRVLLLTGQLDRPVLHRATAAGVPGVLSKAASVTSFVAAVRDVAAGGAPTPADGCPAAGRTTGLATVGDDLTDRELEVLALLMAGRSTKHMARELVLSTHTVRNHVRNLTSKLGASTRLEAVAIARQTDLLARRRVADRSLLAAGG